MSKTASIVLIIVIALAVIIAVAMNGRSDMPASDDLNGTSSVPVSPSPTSTPDAADQPRTHSITMRNDVYTPSSLTVKKGDTVVFVNEGTQPQWPASAVHPTHLIYPEFDPKQAITAGDSWSFTFERVGTWRWHDHIHANVNGTITVTE